MPVLPAARASCGYVGHDVRLRPAPARSPSSGSAIAPPTCRRRRRPPGRLRVPPDRRRPRRRPRCPCPGSDRPPWAPPSASPSARPAPSAAAACRACGSSDRDGRPAPPRRAAAAASPRARGGGGGGGGSLMTFSTKVTSTFFSCTICLVAVPTDDRDDADQARRPTDDAVSAANHETRALLAIAIRPNTALGAGVGVLADVHHRLIGASRARSAHGATAVHERSGRRPCPSATR